MPLTSMLMDAPSSSVDCRVLVLEQVALGLDVPSRGHGGQLVVQLPAISYRGPLVFRARTLQRHAAAVVADRGDLPHLLVAERRSRRHGGQLRALLLDRPRARAALPGPR